MPYVMWADDAVPGLEAVFELERGGEVITLNDRTMLERYNVTDVDGLFDTTGRRESRQPTPGGHGTQRGRRALDEKVVAFTGDTRAGTFAKMRAMQSMLRHLCRLDPIEGVETEAKLRVRPVDPYVLNNYGTKVFINWLANPNFEQEFGSTPTYWGSSAVFTCVEEDQRLFTVDRRKTTYGATSTKVTMAPTGTGPSQIVSLTSQRVPVKPGVTVYASIMAKITSAGGSSALRVGVRWYDLAGNELTQSSIGADLTATTVTKKAANLVAPAGARDMAFTVQGVGSGTIVFNVTNAMLVDSAAPVHFIGPGMPGCASREAPERMRTVAWTGQYQIGHRPHNLSSNPSGSGGRIPDYATNATVAVGAFSATGYQDPTLIESSTLDEISVSVLDRNQAYGFAVKSASAANMNIGDQPIPVLEGLTYAFSGYFEATTNTRNTRMQIIWRDIAAAAITTTVTPSLPETAGVALWQYAEVVAPAGAVTAEPKWEVTSPASGETHVISGRRVTVGPHERYEGGDYPGWNYIGDQAAPYFDNFQSVGTLTSYLDDAGTLDATISGGQMVPNVLKEHLLYRTQRRHNDVQATIKHTAATTFTSYKAGVRLRRVDASTWIGAYMSYSGGVVTVTLAKWTAGSPTTLGSGTLTSTLSTATAYWFRGRVEGNLIVGEHWTTDPALGGVPALKVSFELEAGFEIAAHGAAVNGEAGIYWRPGATGDRVDDFVVQPNVYIDTEPEYSPKDGFSEKTALKNYVLESLDLEVKQAEKQDSPMRRRPFLLTAKARDPRLYVEDERSSSITLVEDPPDYIVVNTPFASSGTVEISVNSPVVGTGSGATFFTGPANILQYSQTPNQSISGTNRFSEVWFSFGVGASGTYLDTFYAEAFVKRISGGGVNYIFARATAGDSLIIGKVDSGVETVLLQDTWSHPAGAFAVASSVLQVYLDGNIVNAVIFDPSGTELRRVTYTLTGAAATKFGSGVAGKGGGGMGADRSLLTGRPNPFIYTWREGLIASKPFAIKTIYVDGDVETPVRFELRGPVENPYIEVPESGIFIITDMLVPEFETVTIYSDGRVTSTFDEIGGGFSGDEGNLLAGTRLGDLRPGLNTFGLGGIDMVGSDSIIEANTQLSVHWRDAIQ